LQKHAYLIMAHDNNNLLNKLLNVLDDRRNDIYLHVDKKVKSIDIGNLEKLQYSRLFLIKRSEVFWGGFSQTNCELSLLNEAIKDEYTYYHLLSGVDFPIKNQNYIHNFFEQNNGKEFLGYDHNWNRKKIKYYYLYTDIGRDKKPITLFKKSINKLLILFQKLIRYSRNYDFPVYKGANWFSITHDLAVFIVNNYSVIKNNFSNTLNSDEFFLQSLVANSDFSRKIYKGINANEYENNLRHIDWNKGQPFTFGIDDLNELLLSDKLFARKFDEKKGLEVVNKLYEYIKEKV